MLWLTQFHTISHQRLTLIAHCNAEGLTYRLTVFCMSSLGFGTNIGMRCVYSCTTACTVGAHGGTQLDSPCDILVSNLVVSRHKRKLSFELCVHSTAVHTRTAELQLRS